MSGLLKGVKKVFKGVGKFVKKIAPFALPIAAVVATVGGMAGIPFFAGGFSGTVGRVLGNGILGKAVTYAGYSGIAGASIGGLTGGMQGAIKGSLMGQAIGGAAGALTGMMAPPAAASGASQASIASGGAAPGMGPQGLSQSTATMGRYGAEIPGQVAGPMSMSSQGLGAAGGVGAMQSQAAQGVTNATYALPSSQMAAQGFSAAQPALRGGLTEMERIAMIGAIGPQIGPAMGALFKKEGDDNPGLAIEEARAKRASANYANPPGVSFPAVRRTPVERYTYDPAAGQIVKTWA